MKSPWFLIVCIILSLYLSVFALQKTNLVTADVGRHIINGEILLGITGSGATGTKVLHTNLFSYTNSDFPFINHQWASGIIFYTIYRIFGFAGLSFFYLFCLVLAFMLSVFTMYPKFPSKLKSEEKINIGSIFLVGLFLIPLIASRTEVRPEGMSYIFLLFFIYLLYQFSKDRLSSKMLWFIPFLEIAWVNIHIYFIFGPFLVGVFLFESIVRKNIKQIKTFSIILGATALATLINPFGVALALYPFFIFHNYGYLVFENQSIHFLENLKIINPNFMWYKITLGLVLFSSLAVIIRKKSKFILSLTIISLTFAVIAYLGIRHMTAFALVSLPLLISNASVIDKYFSNKISRELRYFVLDIIIFLIIFATFINFWSELPWNSNFGVGLPPYVLDSAKFVKENNIRGPIFNNYDIGGYLIFNFFPKEKVFVDNRPEAYPSSFFNDMYVPMQESNAVWQKESAKENFNMIYFYRLDATPWAQSFLIQEIKDPLWAPVYVDDYTIIFLKRNMENKRIIDEYELPKRMFIVK